MSIPLTVVISCAGTGSRLGIGTTKATVELLGRPLVSWQLELLQEVADVRVVVGHDAPRVLEAVRCQRPDALFVFNREFRTTGTAASLALALEGLDPAAEVLSLDGDLLVDPLHMARFVREPGARLGLVEEISSDPVYALFDPAEQSIVEFSRSIPPGRPLEWSGLCRLPVSELRRSIAEGIHRGHVFEMLAPRLPLPFEVIEAREIDTPQDFTRAVMWLDSARHHWRLPA